MKLNAKDLIETIEETMKEEFGINVEEAFRNMDEVNEIGYRWIKTHGPEMAISMAFCTLKEIISEAAVELMKEKGSSRRAVNEFVDEMDCLAEQLIKRLPTAIAMHQDPSYKQAQRKYNEIKRGKYQKHKYKEDKAEIVRRLVPVLGITAGLREMINLKYFEDKNGEKVIAEFEDGRTVTVDVTADSGTAMIKDIIRQLVD